MPSVNFAVLLNRWESLKNSLQLYQGELPELAESRQALATLIQEGTAFSSTQTQLEGALHTVVERREELTTRGKHLVEYIAAGLRRRYGVSNQRLGEFGVRPRRRRRPSPPPVDPPEPPPTEPPPSDS